MVLVWADQHGGRPGRHVLQAAIPALHADAPTYDQIDWRQIVTLYDGLLEVWPSPVVALNRAVAVAMVSAPSVALAEVQELEEDGRGNEAERGFLAFRLAERGRP